MNRIWSYIVMLCVYQWCECSGGRMEKQSRVCIIGAGISGLSTAKHLNDEGITFTILEATKHVGGTWRYDPRVGLDENGEPLYSSMYLNLRTNLPKPLMELGDYQLPEHLPSFPISQSYRCYIKHYARSFRLIRYIKFQHKVILVRRVHNTWNVKHKNVATGEVFEDDYDYIVIGSGIYHKPNYPNIPGNHTFQGTKIHSHDFRAAARYGMRRVLVIGAGFSSLDISVHIARVAKRIVHSHHSQKNYQTKYPKHYIRKPDVKVLNATGAIFVDDSYEELDDIIYCTGYQYYYPYLDNSSEIQVEPTHVTPLHQNVVNINQPTMLFVGITGLVTPINAQARYAVAVIKGNFTLATKKELLKQHQQRVDSILAEGKPLSRLHILSNEENQYYANLTKESGIYCLPSVMYNIRRDVFQSSLRNWYTFRHFSYKIINSYEFNKMHEENFKRNNYPINCTIL